jgi:hypothetical protein
MHNDRSMLNLPAANRAIFPLKEELRSRHVWTMIDAVRLTVKPVPLVLN